MSRTALILSVALAAAAGALPASASAMKSLGNINFAHGGSGMLIAHDQAFAYWVGDGTPLGAESGERSDEVVMRQAFAGGVATEIYRVRDDTDRIVNLEVGGGMVGIGVHRGLNGEFSDGSTRIIRFTRDGGDPIEVASGGFTLDRDKFSNSDQLDCGSVVQLKAMSSTGDLYYALNQRHRKSSPCSNGKNVNTWQYFRFTMDGSRNRFLTSSALTTGRMMSDSAATDPAEPSRFDCACRQLGERDLRVAGHWALAISKRKLTLVNVETGKRTSGHSARPRTYSQRVDLDSTGRVMVQNRLFPKPGSLKSLPLAGEVSNQFCGNRLLATTFKGIGTGTVTVFDRTRSGRLASRPTGRYSLARNQWLFGCTAETLVRIRTGNQIFRLSALALPRKP